MHLYAFGLNHATAPLNVREQVVFHAERLVQALRELVDRRPVASKRRSVSTCNRTEVYCHTDEPRAAIEWMAGYHSFSRGRSSRISYTLPQEQAVKHAFRVASGSIRWSSASRRLLGSSRRQCALRKLPAPWGCCSQTVQRTFAVAKTVRSETDIGASTVLNGSAAVQLAGRIIQHRRAIRAVHRRGRDGRVVYRALCRASSEAHTFANAPRYARSSWQTDSSACDFA
jgi:glutamyl-tRNA reductase